MQFCRVFPEIVHSSSGQSRVLLTWTHYRRLLRVKSDRTRAWYEQEAAGQGWSVRALSRSNPSQLPDEAELRAEIEEQKRIFRAQLEDCVR